MTKWEEETRVLRKDIFLAACASGFAHLASAYSCVEIIYSLYCAGVMRHNPKDPAWNERDRFVMSKGHGSLALYASLSMAGYFPKEQLMKFAKPGSQLGGEPSLCVPLGIEASTGSLGHGLSLGVGMALARKMDHSNAKTYVLLGDGECEEGSVWEAVMAAAKYELSNLVVILDHNRIQKMGPVSTIMGISDWQARFSSFGWDCVEVDGHDVDALCHVLNNLNGLGKPHVVIANTVKGKGISLMEDNPSWHWRIPNRREAKVFLSELGITEEELNACR